MKQPILLNFYDADDEVTATYSRNGATASVMERVMDIAEAMEDKDEEELKADKMMINALGAIIVEFYGDKFTLDELKKKTYFNEWLPFIRQIMARAKGVQEQYSPTFLQSSQKKARLGRKKIGSNGG